MNIRIVPTDQIESVWPEVEPLLARACERSGGRHTPESTFRELREGRQQLFVTDGQPAEVGIPTAAATTHIAEYPSGQTWLTVVLCGGDGIEQWLADGWSVIEAWAKHCGCAGTEIFGRPGWVRALGMRKTGIMMEKAL